jgi:hypothetical protein
MEIARYAFERGELGAISKAKRRALGGVTLHILRRLGSPERLSFTEDAIPDIAEIMAPTALPEEIDNLMPAFDARAVSGRHIITARLPGIYRGRFPVATNVTYLLNEPRKDPTYQNLQAIADIREASITCWPDRLENIDFPSAEELTGDFVVDIAAKALKRLYKENLPDDVTWQIIHNSLE